MGIVISYKGTLDDIARLDNLIADARLFCQQTGWEYTEVNEHISGIAMGSPEDFMGDHEETKPQLTPKQLEEWPEEETFRSGSLTLRFDSKNPDLLEEIWRGIVAHPPGTESLALTFDGRGRLCNYVELPRNCVKGALRDLKHYFCFPLFCKTTGETKQHIAICVLLKMMRDKYIGDLDVHDETGYFETGDLTKLREGHAVMAGLISAVKNNPEFLKAVLKAAGVDKKDAETAVLLPTEFRRTVPENTSESPVKPKKPSIH